MAIVVEELKSIVLELSDVTDPLAMAYPKDPNDFTNVLIGILRKNKHTLIAIEHICDDTNFGGSALDLLRSMIEDVISVDWMILKGKDKTAKKFKRFLPVQFHTSMEFWKELQADIKETDLEVSFKNIEEDFENVKKEFTFREDEIQRSWSGVSTEQMLIDLHDEKALKDFDVSRLTMAYTFGNWKNHLNPYDIETTYLRSDSLIQNGEHAAKQALFIGALVIIRLTQRYIDELRFAARKDIYQDIADKVQKISDQLAAMK
jgi:hypothetical protein